MNRLVTNNPSEIRSEQLPARERGERLRVLFLTSYALGFKVGSQQFEKFTAGREDVEAVHVRINLPRALNLLGGMAAPLRGWDMVGVRRLWLWKQYLGRVLRTHLPSAHFDAAVLTTQNIAGAMPGIRTETGLPYAVYIDTTVPQYCRELGGSRVPDSACVPWEREIFESATVVAGLSRWALDSARDDYGVPESKLLVVRNAAPVPATLPARERRPGGPVRLAIVGNGWVRKGGDRLLRWHQERWKGRAELHAIGADVPVDRSLEGVVWHGAVDHMRLMEELLPSMDVFVLPTRRDMSPYALIEASGRGLPVVSSRLGAIHEIIEHGRTGLLCAPDREDEFIAAVEKLIDDPALRESMGRAGHARMLAEFTPERCYGGLIDRLWIADKARRTGGTA